MGSYTLLFLSLILYLGIKGRLGTYWNLVTTAAAPQTASNQSTPQTSSGTDPSFTGLSGLGMVEHWLGTLSPVQQGIATATHMNPFDSFASTIGAGLSSNFKAFAPSLTPGVKP